MNLPLVLRFGVHVRLVVADVEAKSGTGTLGLRDGGVDVPAAVSLADPAAVSPQQLKVPLSVGRVVPFDKLD